MGDEASGERHEVSTGAAWLRRAWLASLVDRLGPLPARVSRAADGLVAAALDEPDRITPALTRFASALGAAGWDLATVEYLATRLDHLLLRAGCPDRRLGAFDAGAAAGRGWAHGYLPMVAGDSCTDTLTGLATLGVLSWRLRQVYDQCRALGVDAQQVYALAVVDVVRPGTVLERDVARVAAAELVRVRYSAGETVAAAGSRLLVLASRSPHVDVDVEALAADVRAHPALTDASVIAWVEDLPRSADEIDRFLFDMV